MRDIYSSSVLVHDAALPNFPRGPDHPGDYEIVEFCNIVLLPRPGPPHHEETQSASRAHPCTLYAAKRWIEVVPCLCACCCCPERIHNRINVTSIAVII